MSRTNIYKLRSHVGQISDPIDSPVVQDSVEPADSKEPAEPELTKSQEDYFNDARGSLQSPFDLRHEQAPDLAEPEPEQSSNTLHESQDTFHTWIRKHPNNPITEEAPDSEDPLSLAEKSLTPAQKEQITQRNARVFITKPQSEEPKASSSKSCREGPSKPNKGKGPDPREWGNVSLGNDEINLEAQHAELKKIEKAFQKQKALIKKIEDANKLKVSIEPGDRSVQPTLAPRDNIGCSMHQTEHPATSRAINQLAPNSYLACTLDNMDCLGIRKGGDPSDSSSDSSSDSDENPDPNKNFGD
ncbi:hypothetical protein CVT25_015921 [Psilocybe cyanescens]|uniref:Uncharacterized protein n=1 Tax=Psilocybe cyanescens TaxID=93625 RepID=A0A409WSG8_PSICY|nr:hypothetical protein CVT25_015921 [Psilocybe cyanescens]